MPSRRNAGGRWGDLLALALSEAKTLQEGRARKCSNSGDWCSITCVVCSRRTVPQKSASLYQAPMSYAQREHTSEAMAQRMKSRECHIPVTSSFVGGIVAHRSWLKLPGASLLLRTRGFGQQRIKHVYMPPRGLEGRLGGLRVGGNTDITLVWACWPPRPRQPRRYGDYVKTCMQMYEWLVALVLNLVGRSTHMSFMGLNDQAGVPNDKWPPPHADASGAMEAEQEHLAASITRRWYAEASQHLVNIYGVTARSCYGHRAGTPVQSAISRQRSRGVPLFALPCITQCGSSLAVAPHQPPVRSPPRPGHRRVHASGTECGSNKDECNNMESCSGGCLLA